MILNFSPFAKRCYGLLLYAEARASSAPALLYADIYSVIDHVRVWIERSGNDSRNDGGRTAVVVWINESTVESG